MKTMLERVLWIGGSPCSGKSTVAERVAAARGVPVYACDEPFDRHAATIGPQCGPTLKKVSAMGIGDRLAQPIDVQVNDVFRLYREEFPLILRDIADIPGGLLVEGAAVLPESLAARGIARHLAVWLVPSAEFQRQHYHRRTWAHERLAGLRDPQRAFDRWMRRDARFAEMVAEQAHDLGYRVIVVDGRTAADEIAAVVDHALAPAVT
jgi:2-phosphoglycerate kinase